MDWAGIRQEGLSGFAMTAIPPTIQLPALPHAVTLFMQKSTDESTPLDELAKILETDASLTIELLRYVNSSFLGLRQKAKTVPQALSLLGRRRSRMLVFATGTEAALRARKSKLINQSAFWNACVQKALFAREVAMLLGTDVERRRSGWPLNSNGCSFGG
jgi:HD-like signal output (HDOD) protein